MIRIVGERGIEEGEVRGYAVEGADDAAGGEIDAQVLTRGRITGVELYDGQPYLTVGNAILPLSSVIALEEATANAAAEEDEGLMSSIASALNPSKLFS